MFIFFLFLYKIFDLQWVRYQPPIASHPLVLRFFEVKQRKNAKSPNTSKEIFDIAILVNHVIAWDVPLY